MESTAIKYDDEEKWEAEEEEEALSLCDLPVNLIEQENEVQPRNAEEADESQAIKTEDDFDFGSWVGALSTEPEMCSADQVFFKGQILPLRLSVSSDSCLTGRRQDNHNTSRCLSRSESMDHGSLSRFTSISSSRSSSTRSSYNSTSSSNSKSKPIKFRNNFNTHPSPKPQIRLSQTRPVNVSSRHEKSSMWDFFRLGLVRAPELELQDLKVRSNINNNSANRNSVSRNSSCNSSNSSSSTKNNRSKNQQDLNKGFLEKRTGLFSGCKCSVRAVETVPLNNIVVGIKSKTNSEKEKALMSHAAAMEEKEKLLKELKIKKKMKETQQGKQALSHHRTFEWLKELSHASYVDET